jgi:hypothetical protein
MSDITEKLRRRVMTDTNIPDYPRTVLINPDGPEAAEEIERLRHDRAHAEKSWLVEKQGLLDRLTVAEAERDRMRGALVLAESYSDCMGVITVEAIHTALGRKP